MNFPKVRIEDIPREDFVPRYCPHKDCPCHHDFPKRQRPFRYRRHHTYRRKNDGRIIPRFYCYTCRRTFSQQSFATTYFLKRPDLQLKVLYGVVAGSSHRQIANTEGCAPSTIARQAARLGRHCFLLHEECLRQVGFIREDVVYDHFEGFAHSQYFPFGTGTSVGRESWFIYAVDHVPHRRTGRQSPAQKAKQKRFDKAVGRAPRGAYLRGCRRTIDRLLAMHAPSRRLRLVTDAHPAYKATVATHPERERIEHEVYPNPKGRRKGAKRTREEIERDREMFAVDHCHRIFRHYSSHDKRETLAFSRRYADASMRKYILICFRNLIKKRSERRPTQRTPAKDIGLTKTIWTWQRVLAKRLRMSRMGLDADDEAVYKRKMDFEVPGPLKLHDPVFAD